MDILTKKTSLARNTMWNLIGQGIPLLVALLVIPMLIKGLGTPRFGVLALAWAVVGYFNIFDLGLGRALTKLVAEKLGSRKDEDIPNVIWTTLALMGILGIFGTLVVIGILPYLVHDILKIPPVLQDDTLRGFYLLALSIPMVISFAGLRGIIEAYQRFDLVNIVRIPLGIFTFLGPLIVLPFSKSLFPVVAALAAVRLLAWGVQFLLCLHLVPELRHNIRFKCTMVKPLISFGSWMTVTNIVGPIMVYMDRFLIGAFISVTAVTYYATPYEVITKLGLISASLVGVLFPAFSMTMVQDQDRTIRLLCRGMNYLFLVLFPIILIIVTGAYEGLALWLSSDFAGKSVFILQWLAVGVFINSLARVLSALVQGAGRPDLTAKMHLIELPIYLCTLWLLLEIYGIKGAAVAWVLRIGIDTVLLFAIVQWIFPHTRELLWNNLLRIIIAVAIFAVAGYTVGLFIKGMFLIGTLILFIFVTWHWLLDDEDQRLIKRLVHVGIK